MIDQSNCVTTMGLYCGKVSVGSALPFVCLSNQHKVFNLVLKMFYSFLIKSFISVMYLRSFTIFQPLRFTLWGCTSVNEPFVVRTKGSRAWGSACQSAVLTQEGSLAWAHKQILSGCMKSCQVCPADGVHAQLQSDVTGTYPVGFWSSTLVLRQLAKHFLKRLYSCTTWNSPPHPLTVYDIGRGKTIKL